MKHCFRKETCVYTQSQGLGSWMLGYTVWDPFSHHAIFSRHQCLPAKIAWIWIVCSAVQSGLQQESNDSDRHPERTLCVFNKYWTSAGISWDFQGVKTHKDYWTLSMFFSGGDMFKCEVKKSEFISYLKIYYWNNVAIFFLFFKFL